MMGAYTRTDSKKVEGAKISSRKSGTEEDTFDAKDDFKKGGGCMKKGGKALFSEAAKGKKPARASGGGVFSSAKPGTPRGKASHY